MDAEVISQREQVEDSVTSCRIPLKGSTAKKVDDQPFPLLAYLILIDSVRHDFVLSISVPRVEENEFDFGHYF